MGYLEDLCYFAVSDIKDDKDILDMLKSKYTVLGIVKKLAAAKKGIYDGLATVEKLPTSEISLEYINISKIIINESEAS